MKMLHSIFKYVNYGLRLHYQNVETLKKELQKLKGSNSKRRKEIKKKNDKEMQEARLQALRSAHSRVLSYVNSQTSEAKKKHVHPRSKRNETK